MTDETQPKVPILEVAWNLYAQLDALSKKQLRTYYRWFGWISALGVFAILLAVIINTYPVNFPGVLNVWLKVLLISILIAASVLAAFVNKISHQNEGWISRVGAEKIQKEIYLYRTLHKNKPDRREWLERRLNDIQHHLHHGMSGELVLGQSPVKIPPNFDSYNPNSDEGYSDLNGDEYVLYRLENQLAKYIRKEQQYEGERARQRIYILLAGGLGILLAASGGFYSIWVAVTTSLMVVLIGWQGLRNLDPVVKNSSRVVMELMTIYDHWKMLEPEERSKDEFFRMVKSTEDVLLGQDIEYIRPMRDAFDEETEETLEETELKDNVLQEAVENDVEIASQDIVDVIVEETSEGVGVTDSILQGVDEIEEVFTDQKPDSEVEIAPQDLEDVITEKTSEEAGMTESILHGADEIEEAFTDQMPDSEVEIAPQNLEDVSTEEAPEEAGLTERVLQDADEADETFKDQESDDIEVELTSQVLEEFLPEETPEEAELTETVIQAADETGEASEEQKSEIKVGVSKKALDDIQELPDEFVNAMSGSLAEEASSELVQAELVAMTEATSQAESFSVNTDRAGGGRLSDTLDAIAKEFEDVEIGRDTPASVLNDLLARYPTTNDVKG
jgi:membrane protein implicated in regulation of membrane protease activity